MLGMANILIIFDLQLFIYEITQVNVIHRLTINFQVAIPDQLLNHILNPWQIISAGFLILENL